MNYVTLQLFGTSSDFQWGKKLLSRTLRSVSCVFPSLCFGPYLQGGVQHDKICISLQVRGCCTGKQIQSQIGRDLEMLLGSCRDCHQQNQHNSQLVSSCWALLHWLVLTISKWQELPIIFLLWLLESTTTRNPGAQDLLCKLNSSAARNTIKREWENSTVGFL